MQKKISEQDKQFLKTYNPDKYQHPSVTVDILIFTVDIKGKLELLLIKRKKPPYQDCWAIPGGFVNIDESLDTAAARELEEETNITGVHMEQLYTFGEVDRDPRTRVISVVYMALVPKEKLNIKAGDDAKDAKLYGVSIQNDNLIFSENIDLAFDHEQIIKMAVERLRSKLNYTNIAVNLIKDVNRFSIYELQKVHEAILGQEVDKANFRRYFIINYINKGMVEETGEKCTEFSHRASKYYKLIK